MFGPEGVREILGALEQFPDIKTVCIGGINETNFEEALSKSATPKKRLDGIAVVSVIIAAENPREAAKRLLVRPFQIYAETVQKLVASAPEVVKAVHENRPLSHNMTNLVCAFSLSMWRIFFLDFLGLANTPEVVQNFAANVALAVGASPIMSNHGDEAEDLCRLGGALVINMGTVDRQALSNFVKALQAYNQARRPVVFDPVGYDFLTVRMFGMPC